MKWRYEIKLALDGTPPSSRWADIQEFEHHLHMILNQDLPYPICGLTSKASFSLERLLK